MLILSMMLIGAFHSTVRAREPQERSVWDGVYTQGQAERGASIASECTRCHGSGLGGGLEETPPISGPEFRNSWNGQTLADLSNKIRSMPPDAGTPDAQGNVDVIAYLMRINGFPSGNNELEADPTALRQIRIREQP